MVGLTFLQNRYTSYKVRRRPPPSTLDSHLLIQASSAEEFTSASHSVKPGLIASGIVSAWTWAGEFGGSEGERRIANPALAQLLFFSPRSSRR